MAKEEWRRWVLPPARLQAATAGLPIRPWESRRGSPNCRKWSHRAISMLGAVGAWWC